LVPGNKLSTFAELRQNSLKVVFQISITAIAGSSGAGEPPPCTLTDPDVSLSAHPAPIVQPTHTQRTSVQTAVAGNF